MCTQSRHT